MYPTLNTKKPTDKMLQTMLNACENAQIENWNDLKPLVSGELSNFLLMLTWIKDMKQKQEMGIEQARVYVDIQKTTARNKLMVLPGLDVIKVDNILNQSVDSIRKDISDYIGWVII